eukprot:Seg5237.2 transcript_id=Seg5237.2/GoldUCD/mRNA.D3Y31 product="hypothetical protein" protein_id=Seg5237.2/GoldUCD/D3Y31
MNKSLVVIGFVEILVLIYLYIMVKNLHQIESHRPKEQRHTEGIPSETQLHKMDQLHSIQTRRSNKSILGNHNKQFPGNIDRPVSGIATEQGPSMAPAEASREASPWESTPEFILYVRLTSGRRWEREYKDVLVRSMKLFFPAERANLLVVLDGEKEQDHRLGDRLQKEWPYPQICYMDPGTPAVYHNIGKSRMYWDMLHADKCTNVPYVGFVDTDTFVTTFVTPSLLFENGKPVIVGVIGEPIYLRCWVSTTERFLGRKEVVQCMTYFPVIMKTEHLKEMREVLAKEKNKTFEEIYHDSPSDGNYKCICQFSFMCNYVWYHHRREYSWHLQMNPNGDWNGKGHIIESQVPIKYFRTVVKPGMKIPIPRTSIHLRYTETNGVRLIGRPPPSKDVEELIRAGLCYSAGLDFCPKECSDYDRNKVHFHLYSFGYFQWFWDKSCIVEQKKHYDNVKKIVNYYVRNKLAVFSLERIEKLCSLIANRTRVQ